MRARRLARVVDPTQMRHPAAAGRWGAPCRRHRASAVHSRSFAPIEVLSTIPQYHEFHHGLPRVATVRHPIRYTVTTSSWPIF